ncbi:MAG: DUF131 domain-containing protein [Thermoplasmata archaeon]
MRRLLAVVLGLFFLGIALLAISVTQGGGTVYLALIFPVYVGSDIWGFFGILCLITAFFLGFFGLIPGGLPVGRPTSGREAAPPAKKPRTKFGGVVMLGPIPIIIGSDMKMSIIAIVLAIILIVVLIVSLLLFIPGLVG